MIDTWRHDFTHGLRVLAKSRVFAIIAVSSLALGIGASTAIFSVADSLLFKSLPYPDANRIAIVWQRSPGLGVAQDWLSLGQYLDIANENSVFTDVAAAIGASVNLTGGAAPERVDGMRVSSSFFSLFGARAALGRTFGADDDKPGKAPSVILNHGFWRRRFGADRNVIGKTLTLNGTTLVIVGVMASDFSFTKEVMPAVNGIQQIDLLLPLPLSPSARANRAGEDFNIFVKLRPGIALERAQTDMDAIAGRMKQQYPAAYPPNGRLTLSVVPLLDQVVGDVRLALYVLLGAVGLVLFIACGNVANLLLARAAAREREMAIRAAVGADRRRLLRQLLIENVVLAVIGAVLGLALAAIAVEALRTFAPANLPRIAEVGVDWRMLAFATVVSLATAILFGLAPALRASRVDATATVRTGSGAVTQARSAARTRKALIAGEIAFAMIVLVGAALLVESYRRIADANPGFDPRHVLSLRISLPSSRYKTPDAVSQFYDQLDRDLHALPGVVSVGSNYQLPLSSVALAWEPIGVEGYVPKGANNLIIASSAYISADYLGAMGMPLLAGRIFSQQDNRQSPPVVIVNQSLAARFWPNQSAIGKRIRQGEDGAWRTVVGVVRDNRDYEPLAQPPITAYFPVKQFNIGSRFVVVRTAASIDPTSVTSAAIRAIHFLDADLPAYDVSTMERRLSDSLSRRRLSTALLAAFGVMALLLAAVGIYGGVAYWVEQRTREIGIRVAIGANQLNVLALIARELAGILGVGMTAGLAAALMLTRLMNGLLFGVTATDLATFAVVSLILALVSVLATLVPARRAMAVQPLVAMRLD